MKRIKNSIKLFIVWFGNYHKLIFTEVLQNFIMSNIFFFGCESMNNKVIQIIWNFHLKNKRFS